MRINLFLTDGGEIALNLKSVVASEVLLVEGFQKIHFRPSSEHADIVASYYHFLEFVNLSFRVAGVFLLGFGL